jgi:Raf kinase inhibitor-like YbhB/YbcL family protein
MRLWTDAIDENGAFDARYTCDIDNSSPELRWSDPPERTAGFALIAEDIDAPNSFAHWVVYAIPGTVTHLPTGIPPQDSLPNGIRQGLNGFGKLGYYGPCPPHGERAHRYRFRLFALRELPEFLPRLSRDALLDTIRGLIIETAELVGSYRRAIERAG